MNNAEKILRYPNRIALNDINELRKYIGKNSTHNYIVKYDYAILLGKDSVNDGKAREYFYDNHSMHNDNNDTIIKPNNVPNSAPGRWHLVKKSDENIKTQIIEFEGYGTTINYRLAHNLDSINFIVQIDKVLSTNPVSAENVDVHTTKKENYLEVHFSSPPDNNVIYRALLIKI